MAHVKHPHLRRLVDDHRSRKKGPPTIYVGEDGTEAVVLGDTVHAARPGQEPQTAHRKSLKHQTLGELAHKLTAPGGVGTTRGRRSQAAAAVPVYAHALGASVQVYHDGRGEWGEPTLVLRHVAWRGQPGYQVADRVPWVPESHVRAVPVKASRGAGNPTALASTSRAAAPSPASTRGMGKSKTRIVLISCSKTQAKVPRGQNVRAVDLYTAPLFKDCVALARTMVSSDSQIRILSGKHGLIKLSDKIPGKDITLHDIGKRAQRVWGVRVVEQLRRAFGTQRREYVFLAGEVYADAITQTPKLFALSGWRFEEPLRHEGIGVRGKHVRNLLIARGITPPSQRGAT